MIMSGILIDNRLCAIGRNAVSSNSDMFPISFTFEIKCAIVLIYLCEVEFRIIHGSIINITTLFTEVAAYKIHDTVLVNRAIYHGLRTSIRMIMSREHKSNARSLGCSRYQLVITCTASVGVGIIRRLMNSKHLPSGIAALGVANEPCQSFFKISVKTYACNINIAMLHRIIVSILHSEEHACCIACRITIILMVAHGMYKACAGKSIAKDSVYLAPHNGVAAVVDIVAGLDTKIDIRCVCADFIQEINSICICRIIA